MAKLKFEPMFPKRKYHVYSIMLYQPLSTGGLCTHLQVFPHHLSFTDGLASQLIKKKKSKQTEDNFFLILPPSTTLLAAISHYSIFLVTMGKLSLLLPKANSSTYTFFFLKNFALYHHFPRLYRIISISIKICYKIKKRKKLFSIIPIFPAPCKNQLSSLSAFLKFIPS